jgi:hypothetical protein
METNNKRKSTREVLELLVKDSAKHGVLLERVDDNLQKLAEGFGLFDNKVSKIETTIGQMDDRLIRVEANQIADREDISTIKGKRVLLEKKAS